MEEEDEEKSRSKPREVIGADTDIILESVGNVGGRFFLVGSLFDCRPNEIGINATLLVEDLVSFSGYSFQVGSSRLRLRALSSEGKRAERVGCNEIQCSQGTT